MNLYACFILFVLVLNTRTVSREEMDIFLRNLDNHVNSNKRLHSEKKGFYSLSKFFSKHKHHTSTENTQTDSSSSTSTPIVQDPVRVAIFNAGNYNVHIKLNYTLNNQQIEDELYSDIKNGQHRSIFIPKIATSVRICVKQTSILHTKLIIDEQIADLKDSKGFCYLLAHTSSYPVYGLCPSTYQAMVDAWGKNS